MGQQSANSNQRNPYDMSYDKSRQGKCIFVYGVNNARRISRYQMGNHNKHIEEEQTRHWPKEQVQRVKQRSTKHADKTKDRVTRNHHHSLSLVTHVVK